MYPPVTLLPEASEGSDLPPVLDVIARTISADAVDALSLARALGRVTETPGHGRTRFLWEGLATIAAFDLGVARTVEPHLDALAILREAGVDPIREFGLATWGVFAAEGGNDPLTARRVNNRWSLTGTKPWCSLADRLDRALVTAHLEDGDRGLFAVDLGDAGVCVQPERWHARGLAEIPSGPVTFLDVGATPVGESGWYLRRPGFAWGGIGVAAAWYGGAVGIGRTVCETIGEDPDPLRAAHLGRIDQNLQAARRSLAEAAVLIDERPTRPDGSVLARRVRGTVATASEDVLARAAHAMGPAPLALDAAHSKRVADLELYIRQHHAEKDDASLGSALAGAGQAPW